MTNRPAFRDNLTTTNTMFGICIDRIILGLYVESAMAHTFIHFTELLTHTLCIFVPYETAGAITAVILQLPSDFCSIFLIRGYSNTHALDAMGERPGYCV